MSRELFVQAMQDAYADGLDLVETSLAGKAAGRLDEQRVNQLLARLAASPIGMVQLVSFQANLLTCCLAELQVATGRDPDWYLVLWRQQAARAVNLGEARLAGEPT